MDAWEIVTETEPEWDDPERSRMLGLVRYETRVCECGFHESLTHDPSNHFTPEVDQCPVCKGVAQFVRVLNAGDDAARKALGENRPPATPDPADGRHVRMRMMSADEVQARRRGSD